MDPVIAIIMKAGSLSLRELFSRVGTDAGTRLRVAALLKNGEVKFERFEGADDTVVMPNLDIAHLTEQQLAAEFSTIPSSTAENIAIAPTAKAWRNPFHSA